MQPGTTLIQAVHGELAPYRYTQEEVTEAVNRMGLVGAGGEQKLADFHTHSRVHSRYLSLPLERYADLADFGDANDAYIEAALDNGEAAIKSALDEAELAPSDVDAIFTTSSTGVAVPSVDARLASRVGFRPDIKRIPIFGLGCLAGAAGVARLHDYLRAWPDHVALLLSIELCSLTLQRGDRSTANMVASALFGDGVAAVVACGADRGAGQPGPRIVATRSRLYPNTERVMGWDIGASGFQIVLSPEVPDVVRRYIGDDVRAFLADHGLTLDDITAWVCHPGGPKVLEAVQDALELPEGALDVTWRSLAEIGNLSSASVLYVLRDTMRDRRPPAGTPGVLLAMGPGFGSELVLLRW